MSCRPASREHSLSEATTSAPASLPSSPSKGQQGEPLPPDPAGVRTPNPALDSIVWEWGIRGEVWEAARRLPAVVDSAAVEPCPPGATDDGDLCRKYVAAVGAPPAVPRRGTREAHRLVQLFMASYQDPRLAVLAAAHLWQGFVVIRRERSLLGAELDRTFRQVMLPFYSLLGLWSLRLEVADWLVQNGPEHERYRRLGEALARSEPLRSQAFAQAKLRLGSQLPGAVIRRSHRSALRVSRSLIHADELHPEQFDRVRVEVVVEGREQCYQALGCVHQLWRPQEGGTMDYISAPNLNGYRGLHTAVIIPVGLRYVRGDFRIFTPEMGEVNEWGIVTLFRDSAQRVETPGSWWNAGTREAGCRCIASGDPGALPPSVHVFTPQGQLVEFPRGASVVDYAYSVHSEVANQTAEFRINGEVVEPTATLHHLDLVELVQDSSAAGPTRIWLSAAHTGRARTKIERHLKLHGGKAVEGRALLNERVQELEKHYGMQFPRHRLDQRLQDAAQRMKLGGIDDLLIELAARRVLPDKLLHPLFSEEMASYVRLPDNLWLRPFQISFAQCCRPRLRDDIAGAYRIRHGAVMGLRIHRADCPNRPADPAAPALDWRMIPANRETYTIEVAASDEPGLLGWVLDQVYDRGQAAVLLESHATSRYGRAHISMVVEINETATLEQILAALRGSAHHRIETVRSLSLSASEVNDLESAARSHAYNPYGRLPVTSREMFFGRKKEISRLQEWIYGGAGMVILSGVKRVGKTSLLRQLQRHFLDAQATAPVFLDFQVWCADDTACAYETACALHDALAGDQHTWQLGHPVREAFQERPAASLIEFLHKVQDYVAPRRLVLLIDEFSRAFESGIPDDRLRQLLEQWQQVVHATAPDICFIFVVHRRVLRTLESVRDERVRSLWAHFAASGETLSLYPFSTEEARELVLSPVRNVLEYDEDAVAQLLRLTGGSPYLLHVLCGELVRMAHDQRLPVLGIHHVEEVAARFLNPQENLYRHLEDEVRGRSIPICLTLARLGGDDGEAVSQAFLKRFLPDITEPLLAADLENLQEARILSHVEGQKWRFSSLLFSRWLAQKAA